jgi:CDP-4-dehydro-6-deoxyglucose reductase, E3
VAQVGLKASWKQQGYFLSCRCKPESDLTVERCDDVRSFPSRVVSVDDFSPGVLRVQLERPAGFAGAAGQFVQVTRPEDGLTRPYSVASLPDLDTLELHVARLPGGQMSQWLPRAVGASIELRGPFGDCVYIASESTRPLLLAGTGTGLAPLIGVLRAALAARHSAPIHIIHGARDVDGLYARRELEELAAEAPMLRAFGSVLSLAGTPEAALGAHFQLASTPIDQMLHAQLAALPDCRVYLAGNPELVHRLRKQAFLGGVPLQRIHADPFVPPATIPVPISA